MRNQRPPMWLLVVIGTLLIAAALGILLAPEDFLDRTVQRMRSGLRRALAPAPTEKTPAPATTVAAAFPGPNELDGAKAMAEVTSLLAIGPRPSGSEGATRAAAHLAVRLKTLGISPEVDEFRSATPEGERTFRNVLGTIKGASDTQVILVSHYDTKAGISDDFVGANDSGSSSGLLLELGRVLKNSSTPLPFTITLAFLDGEECLRNYTTSDGLQGSRRLAEGLRDRGLVSKVKAVFVLDMIGDRILNVAIPGNSDVALTALILRAAQEEGVRPQFSLNENPVTDDHVPFLAVGIAAVDLIDFTYGSAAGRNDYWHTAQDTADKLSVGSLTTVGRVMLRTLALLPTAPHAPKAKR